MPQSLTPASSLYLNHPEKARPMRPKNPGCSTFFRFKGGIGSTIGGGGQPLPPDAARARPCHPVANPSRLRSGPVEHSIDFRR